MHLRSSWTIISAKYPAFPSALGCRWTEATGNSPTFSFLLSTNRRYEALFMNATNHKTELLSNGLNRRSACHEL